MSNITRKVTRQIPAPMQFWNSASDTNDSGGAIVAGDIFKISDSLNGPARTVDITTTSAGSMSFRTNNIITLYPSRPSGEFLYNNNIFVASGVTYTDTSENPVVIQASSSVSLVGPINDIQIVTNSGAFTLRAKR